jgi:ankyrin repeat protein
MAILYGNIQVVRALLDSGKVDQLIKYNYPILAAVSHGNLKLIAFLLDYPKFDLDNSNVTYALSQALFSYKADIVRLMLPKIPLTNGEYLMDNLCFFSKEVAAMVINDGYNSLT